MDGSSCPSCLSHWQEESLAPGGALEVLWMKLALDPSIRENETTQTVLTAPGSRSRATWAAAITPLDASTEISMVRQPTAYKYPFPKRSQSLEFPAIENKQLSLMLSLMLIGVPKSTVIGTIGQLPICVSPCRVGINEGRHLHESQQAR